MRHNVNRAAELPRGNEAKYTSGKEKTKIIDKGRPRPTIYTHPSSPSPSSVSLTSVSEINRISQAVNGESKGNVVRSSIQANIGEREDYHEPCICSPDTRPIGRIMVAHASTLFSPTQLTALTQVCLNTDLCHSEHTCVSAFFVSLLAITSPKCFVVRSGPEGAHVVARKMRQVKLSVTKARNKQAESKTDNPCTQAPHSRRPSDPSRTLYSIISIWRLLLIPLHRHYQLQELPEIKRCPLYNVFASNGSCTRCSCRQGCIAAREKSRKRK